MESFIGSIIMFGGTFAIRSYSFCDGTLLATSQNQALFSLLGTMYGGDGRSSYALPELRGRAPVHVNSGLSPTGVPYPTQGTRFGVEAVALAPSTMPTHSHAWQVSRGAASTGDPAGNLLPNEAYYHDDQSQTPLELYSESVAETGGSQAHNNMMPYLAINFMIAMQGIYPTRP